MIEDCYYFLYSFCKLGDKCSYRHNESSKDSFVVCRNWKAKRTCSEYCPFRHSEYHLKRNRDEETCYWETKPKGCTKARCEYKHMNPEKDFWKTTSAEACLRETYHPHTFPGSKIFFEEIPELKDYEDASFEKLSGRDYGNQKGFEGFGETRKAQEFRVDHENYGEKASTRERSRNKIMNAEKARRLQSDEDCYKKSKHHINHTNMQERAKKDYKRVRSGTPKRQGFETQNSKKSVEATKGRSSVDDNTSLDELDEEIKELDDLLT